jgi:hypothetical protein
MMRRFAAQGKPSDVSRGKGVRSLFFLQILRFLSLRLTNTLKVPDTNSPLVGTYAASANFHQPRDTAPVSLEFVFNPPYV